MFYSITNCQQGLRGVSFGNFLIKQVAEDLGRELPGLKLFATLSPIPGLRKWLGRLPETLGEDCKAALADIVSGLDSPRWFEETTTERQERLLQLAAWYLLYAKDEREPLDPVARFHLVNGARLERLNWLGDTSPTGLRQSAGMMVNYVYRLGEVEANHEAYARDGTIIASRRLEQRAKESLLARGIAPTRRAESNEVAGERGPA
jgi:malonyl-CoA decarboxylase